MIAGIFFIILGFVFWINTRLSLIEVIAILVGVIGICLVISAMNTPDDPKHQKWTHFQ
jgi:drug/metabolite transporter (DMT)-like permease